MLPSLLAAIQSFTYGTKYITETSPSTKFSVEHCLPLKIRGIEKATWDKKLKNSRRNFKSPKRLNSSPEAPRKKKNSVKCSKIKIPKKKIKCRSSTNSNRKPLRNLKSENSNFMAKSNSP
jgi:hypothetical protein